MLKKILVVGGVFVFYTYLTIVQQVEFNSDAKVIDRFNFRRHKDVQTDYGTVRGWVADDGDYYAFLGIPYASVPSGARRFQAPVFPPPYHGIIYGNRTVKCPQMNTGDLDCLILNIFTPEGDATSSLPVLVYFHGGSYQIGVASTKGVEPLIREDIIVVTANYRLGPLGFLCLGIDEAPGNAGLKDQVAALKWVKNNIRHFGGDPNRITVYGMSAGASSVDFHILTNNSRGLFHRAIMESAAASAVFALDPTPISTAKELLKLMEFPDAKSVKELAEQYMNASVGELSQVSYDFYYNKTDGLFGLAPCVENNERTDVYLNKAPYDILSNENYDKVPIMVIFASLEGLFLNSEKFYGANYPERIEENFSNFIPADLAFDDDVTKAEVVNKIKHFYFKNETIRHSCVMNFLNYFGDTLVLRPLLESVRFHSKSDNPVYLMEFAYKGNMGSYEKFYDNIELAGHGDAIKHAILIKPILNNMDKLMVDRVSRVIGNYVKHGNPIPESSSLLPVTWPVVQPGKMSYLRMDKELKVLENPRREMVTFWDSLYSIYRRNVTAVDPKQF